MDDFFEDIPNEENKDTEHKTEPPVEPHTKNKKVGKTVLSIVLAVVCFLLGGFTVWFSLDGEIRTLIKIKATIDTQYYKDIEDETFYDAVFGGVNGILDQYSYYMTADEYVVSKDSMAGNRSGIGLVFSTLNEENTPQMKIVRVCGNSPAEKAGIIAGGYVTGFGKTETELTDSVVFDEFAAFLETFAAGEVFYIRMQVNDTVKVFPLAKEVYVENYLFYRTSTHSYGFIGEDATELAERGAPLSCLDSDTAYIRLMQFGGEVVDSFEQVMELFKSQGKKNLVLDLRENGGGYLDVMQELASYFCKTATEQRPVVAIADYGERQEKFKAKRNVYNEYFSEDSRICVLADNGTASASECLIGCMVDYGAVAYGDICLSYRGSVAKTFGKGIMQTTYYLGAKLDALKLTTAEILWPSGHCIHGRGVLPEDGTKTVAEGVTDELEIAAAIQTLF